MTQRFKGKPNLKKNKQIKIKKNDAKTKTAELRRNVHFIPYLRVN